MGIGESLILASKQSISTQPVTIKLYNEQNVPQRQAVCRILEI